MSAGPFFKTPPKPKPKWRKRVNPVSDRRRQTNVIRRAQVEATFGRWPECHACAPLLLVGISRLTTGCNGLASDAHEVLSRARSGLEENLTDPDGILPVSRECHDFLTRSPDLAEAAGLALPSRPVRQPLLVRDPRTGAMTQPRSVP